MSTILGHANNKMFLAEYSTVLKCRRKLDAKTFAEAPV